MRSYFIKRILWMLPTLFGIVTITFFLTKLRPDPLSQMAFGPEGLKDTSAAEQYLQELRRYYGYDKPLWEQYLLMWKNILTLDFSTSRVDKRKVLEKIAEALPYTLILNAITIFVVYLISVPLGIWSAIHDATFIEKTLTFLLYILYSLPGFWVALLLLRYLAGGDYLDLFPLGGFRCEGYENLPWYLQLWDILHHLVLPVTVSVYGSIAFMSRFVKSSFLEALKADYIRTAKAKGLTQRRIIYIHALRNSLIPLITLMAGLLPALFGGSVIVEKIFSIPGLGKLAYDSVYANDDPVIIAEVFISAVLTMLGILLADLAYAKVDPRITFEKTEVH
ncbi:MAG: ABC transporter permease [Leptospiraceae bacterium]|nr:ABC transporter permease [Leptospiraceae bacterium]MDW8305714.1 ABC transporter permease [Leptospiraceae bacterium]